MKEAIPRTNQLSCISLSEGKNHIYWNIQTKKAVQFQENYTLSAEETFALPSASRADREPIPTDGKTARKHKPQCI